MYYMDVRLIYKLKNIKVELKRYMEDTYPTLDCFYYTSQDLIPMFEVRLENTTNAYLPLIIHNVNRALDNVSTIKECMIRIYYSELYDDIKSRSDATVATSWVTKEPPTSFQYTYRYGFNGPYLGDKSYVVEEKHLGPITKEWLREREADQDLLAPYHIIEGPRFEVIDYIIPPSRET